MVSGRQRPCRRPAFICERRRASRAWSPTGRSCRRTRRSSRSATWAAGSRACWAS